MWFFFVVKMKLFCIRMSFLWKLLSNKSKENLFISHCEKWFDLVDNLINFIEIVVGKEWYTPAALSVKNWTVEFTDILLSVIFFFWYSGEIKTLFTHNMVEFGLDNVRLSPNLFFFVFFFKENLHFWVIRSCDIVVSQHFNNIFVQQRKELNWLEIN